MEVVEAEIDKKGQTFGVDHLGPRHKVVLDRIDTIMHSEKEQLPVDIKKAPEAEKERVSVDIKKAPETEKERVPADIKKVPGKEPLLVPAQKEVPKEVKDSVQKKNRLPHPALLRNELSAPFHRNLQLM